MKCLKGYLTAYNADTKKQMPFFVNVRSEDVVMTDPVVIGEVLQHTSMRWRLNQYMDAQDFTLYEYTASWDDLTDPNGEVIESTLTEGTVRYLFYKDGLLEVSAELRLGAAIVNDGAESIYGESKLCLPYALPGQVHVHTNFIGGRIQERHALRAKMVADIVHNQQININELDKTQHYYIYNCFLSAPQSERNWYGTGTRGVETVDAYKTEPYRDYVLNHVPIEFHVSCWWKNSSIPTGLSLD